MSEKYAAYCGLYCGHCFSRTHIHPAAETLRAYMKRQGFETFGPYMPNYKEFWAFLGTLIDAEGCPGCRQDGGSPGCAMRACARERKLEACPLCAEYPCEKFDWLPTSTSYPMLARDNALMREEGFEAWLKMQEERRARGFTYVEEREKDSKAEREGT